MDIDKLQEYSEVPQEVVDYVKYVEEQVNVPVSVVSVGPDRSQTLFT